MERVTLFIPRVFCMGLKRINDTYRTKTGNDFCEFSFLCIISRDDKIKETEMIKIVST